MAAKQVAEWPRNRWPDAREMAGRMMAKWVAGCQRNSRPNEREFCMNEELWGWLLMSMVSVAPLTDADVQPHVIGTFQTQAACEAAGKQLNDSAILFAKSVKKEAKVRAAHICLQQSTGRGG